MHTYARCTLFGATLGALMSGFTASAMAAPARARERHETACAKPRETDFDRLMESAGASTFEEVQRLNAESKGERYIPVPVRVPVKDSPAKPDAQQGGLLYLVGYGAGVKEGEDAVCRKMHREVQFCETAE